jgi:hypothetical protein
LVIVIAVIGILASAFVGLMVPMTNFFLYYPQASRVNSAATDLINIILEGDEKARGLRFAGPACKIGGAGGGGNSITEASTSGTVSTLTYNYVDAEYCGTGAARVSHTVTLAYDSSTGTVTRSIDGGTADFIPYYVTTTSDIKFQIPGGGSELFHYFGASGADLGNDPLASSISYVKNVGTNNSKVANTSLSVTVPAGGVAAGNLVVVSFAIDGVSGTVSASDTQGNVYTVAANAQYATPGTGNIRTVILYSVLNTALVSGNTITVSYPSRAAKAISVDEYTGVNTPDVFITATGATTTPSTGNIATNENNELLVAAFGVEGAVSETFTAGGSFNASPPTESGTTGGTAATNATIDPAYQIVGSAGTYAATATLSVSTDCARALVGFFNSSVYRVDVDVIALQGNGNVENAVGQIRLKSGIQIKQYTT